MSANMVSGLYALLRTVLLLALVLVAGWWTLFLRGRIGDHEREIAARDGQIDELRSEVSARDRRIDELDLAVRERDDRIVELEAARRLLKVDHRLARIEVLEQSEGPDGGTPRTRIRFTEIGEDGAPLGPPLELEVEGRRVYIESLVVKFHDEFVEGGDFLRGTSVCLFRRAFGEAQSPSEGVPLDTAGRRPRVYAGDDDADPFFDDLWQRFWDIANDPELASLRGVRAIHGEAPFLELRPGQSYLVELRASGGLAIRAEPPPPR